MTKKVDYAVDLKQGDQSNYLFTVNITAEQKQMARARVLREYQKEAVQPGFRKGHVPLDMVEKLANPANIMMAVLEDIVNGALQQAISGHEEKRWIGQIYNLDTAKYGLDTEDGVMTFSLDVFPEVVAKNDKWKTQKVKPYNVEVTQEEIDKTIVQLQSSYATFDDVDVVSDSTLMRLKITFLNAKGEQIGNTKNQYLGQEELAEHTDIQKKFVGHKKGDIVELDYKKASVISLLNATTEESPKNITCEIIDIKQKVLPELNQDFIDKTFTKEDNITSVEILIEKIKETLQANKEENELLNWADEYLKSIEESFTLVIPQTLVDEETKHRMNHLGEQLGGEKGLQAYLDRMGEEEAKKYVGTITDAAKTSIQKYFVMKYVADELELGIDWSKNPVNGEVEKKLYEKLVK